jgi:hypothetical protein
MLRQTCVFASGGICVTRSGFRSVHGAKHRCSIFHALVGRYRFYKMSVGTRYAEHVFLHPVGYAGHVVHFGASGELNGHALFFMLGWDQYGLHKTRIRTRYAELVFCILWDL